MHSGFVPVVEVVRNGFVEGVHFGALIGLNADGSVAFQLGDVEQPVHPRSTNKLMQAAAMRGLGLPLRDQLLALSAASHWGQPRHLQGVRDILAGAGLDESALQTPPALPEDDAEKQRVIRTGIAPSPIMHGCSGKHAAMLATCVACGWDVDSYLQPSHPLQRALLDGVESTAQMRSPHTAVDGCGAPAWALSLRALATGYRSAVLAPSDVPLGEVAAAMRAHPEYVCGGESEITGLMRSVPGLLAKDGAESVYAAALSDGRAVALKIADGGFRAGQVLLVTALERLGALDEDDVDVEGFRRWASVPVLGGGRAVGGVTALPFP